ncbi:MAG: hypothetical protein WB764_27395 [Xanthobacteraceae bacterium]
MALGVARRLAIQCTGAAAIALTALMSAIVSPHAADTQSGSGAAIGGQPTDQSDQSAPGNQTMPEAAQRAVLYEEDASIPQGRQSVGSAVWRTETVSPAPGRPAEPAIRADIKIPERGMIVTWSLRRNSDPTLPASHVIEIRFKLPSNFPDGGIASVPGVLAKDTEQSRGMPLKGLTVKVSNEFFMIGLSAVEADRQRNLQLLKDEGWFDMPIYYTDGERAIVAVQKGRTGNRVFTDAFAAWGQ